MIPIVAQFYKWLKEINPNNIMNPQQKQMLNMMYASTAKTEEELNKMTPDEKKEYLRSRLQQKMNIGVLQRRTNSQKTQIQEKLQGTSGEVEVEGEEKPKAKSKSAKKREKERMKKLQNAGAQLAEVKKSESESDYESDKEEN
jgi:hypothetical protein